MDARNIAERLLAALGGAENISANGLCATRLRVIIRDHNQAAFDDIGTVPGVLGTVRRGGHALDIVFGPGLVFEVFEEFSALTGIDGSSIDGVPVGNTEAISMKIQISPGKKRSYSMQAKAKSERTASTAAAKAADDGAALAELLHSMPQPESAPAPAAARAHSAVLEPESLDAKAKVLVINGPNINMLGIREPGIYGHSNYEDLLELCHASAKEMGFSRCRCVQSNHEGDLIDVIQDAYQTYEGIVINPGAYTHTSVALLDALKAVGIPTVEVHISDVESREGFRQISYVREACIATVSGEGIEGYRSAMRILAKHLGL